MSIQKNSYKRVQQKAISELIREAEKVKIFVQNYALIMQKDQNILVTFFFVFTVCFLPAF